MKNDNTEKYDTKRYYKKGLNEVIFYLHLEYFYRNSDFDITQFEFLYNF